MENSDGELEGRRHVLAERYLCCHHLMIAKNQFADMGRKVKELQAVLDKHVPDVAEGEGILEIQPGETGSVMVFFCVTKCFPQQCGMLHTARQFWKKPLLDETVKVLV